jgi:oligopeptide transport system ATP-binding protein
LKREEELTYLFIAHDLSVVKLISDRIAVIFKGKIVELAESDELFSRPLHLYTQCLLSAIPLPDPESEKNKVLKVYDTSIHNYQNEKTLWQEAYPGHWVLASERELDFWRE